MEGREFMNDAKQNLEALRSNPYPGRGIAVGLSDDGKALIQVYWIMGRSANSRNRVFESEGGRLWTAAADPAKVADPSLIIYNAMDEQPGVLIVSNGDQTDTIARALRAGGEARVALATREYEPDAPNYTPRISAVCDLRRGAPLATMSVLKRSAQGDGCDRLFFEYESFAPGLGRCVTTYRGDGSPLPPFDGEPWALPLEGTPEDVLETVWDALNADNRVSLAVKRSPLDGGPSSILIRNQYSKVG